MNSEDDIFRLSSFEIGDHIYQESLLTIVYAISRAFADGFRRLRSTFPLAINPENFKGKVEF